MFKVSSDKKMCEESDQLLELTLLLGKMLMSLRRRANSVSVAPYVVPFKSFQKMKRKSSMFYKCSEKNCVLPPFEGSFNAITTNALRKSVRCANIRRNFIIVNYSGNFRRLAAIPWNTSGERFLRSFHPQFYSEEELL